MKKICYIAPLPAAVNSFLKPHIYRASKIYEITVITSFENKVLLKDFPIRIIELKIERKPYFLKDIATLFNLIFIFRNQKFDLIHSITTKTGFLAMLAGFISFVPIRIHTFTGQFWSTKTGLKKLLGKFIDKIITKLATHIFLDSPSQNQLLISENILLEGQGNVIGNGSICGVNINKFLPNLEVYKEIRKKYNIPHNSKIILFLGRVKVEKGIFDLLKAFQNLLKLNENMFLFIVGPEEDVKYIQIKNIMLDYGKNLRLVKYTSTPEKYMMAADIFCLPSYREGFGQAIIEAAATGVPAVATKISGVIDAVEDYETGFLYDVGNIKSLQEKLRILIENKTLLKNMGKKSRKRAKNLFSNEIISTELINFYQKIL